MSNVVASADVGYLLYSLIPLDWLYALARVHGRLTYLIHRRQRSTVRRNLVHVVDATKTPREIDSLTRRFFEYRAVRRLFQALGPRLTSAEMARLFPVEGLEHLDAALQQKRGVILLGSHLNSLAMFNTFVMFRERGYNVGVALPEDEDPWQASALGNLLARLFKTKPMRELTGAFYAQFNVRPIVRALADGVIVAQTGDGLHSVRFVEVEFLGRQIPFSTGMARIAQMTGALVVPIFLVGAPPHQLRVVIEEPWTVAGDDGEAAVRETVARYAKRLEHHLLENVLCWEHWLIDDALATMTAWPQKTLEERYKI